MSDIQVTLKLSEESKRFLRRFPEEFRKRFYRGLYRAMKFAEGKSKASFGQDGKPKVRTGMLRRSVGSDVDIRGDDMAGVLFATTVYSRIHELGGTAGFGANIPARPYLEPALRDNIRSIEDIIEKEIIRSTE